MAGFGAGTGFGQPTATPAGTLTFGGFGTPAPNTTAASTGFSFSGFGAQPPTTTAATGFNFGSFGAPSTSFGTFGTAPTTTTTTGTGFSFGSGFGMTTTTAGSGFGLGTGFGTSSTAAAAPIAGGAGTGFGFGGFGSTATAPSSGSGFSFGSLGTGTGALGLSGASALGGTQTVGLFGKPTSLGTGTLGQVPLAGGIATAADASLSNLMVSLYCPTLYGDERDTIIAKWNQLQAFWGVGKGYFAISAPPVEYAPSNPFCRFKAVGYSCLPSSKNEDGFVALIFNQKDVDIRAQQHQVVEGLHRVLGSRPTFLVCVEGVKPSIDNKSEVTIYVLERLQTGVSRRIPTSELFNYLNQANVRQQLTMLGVEGVVPKALPTPEQLSQYLENPPSGIDTLVWQQARLDNPNPDRLIPVPMVGFSELQRRLKCQEEETKVHQGRLNTIAGEINTLQNNHSNTIAKISEHRRQHLELARRILKVMVRQEIGRKRGLAVQADEEQLRAHLEAINTELSAPNRAKGQLNELMSQIRLQKEYMSIYSGERYSVDPTFQEELKHHLKSQQDGLAHLVSVVREDMECLKVMEDGLKGEARQSK